MPRVTFRAALNCLYSQLRWGSTLLSWPRFLPGTEDLLSLALTAPSASAAGEWYNLVNKKHQHNWCHTLQISLMLFARHSGPLEIHKAFKAMQAQVQPYQPIQTTLSTVSVDQLVGRQEPPGGP